MMDRRTALGGVSGAALGLTTVAGGAHGASPAAISPVPKLPKPILGPRMNFAQADKVMTQLGLDALVLGGGVNLYHATGLDLTAPRMGHTPGVYAVVTRNDKQRLSVVAPAFLYYYTIALDHRGQDYPVYVYTAPEAGAPPPAAGDEPPAQKLVIFADRGEAKLDLIERTRASVVEAALAQEAARPNLMYALRKALKDAGVARGRIAVDLPPVRATTAEAAPEATLTDADDALRRIRPVKSAVEIELMRQAAFNNAEAAKEAVRTVRAGGDVRDLRASFFAAAALRGMRGVFMVIDRVSSPTYEATFRDGQCFSVDCVSEYMGYHGDFARAVFVGEPPRSMKKVTEATGKAWEIVRQSLRPGLTFAEVQATGKKALKDMGVDYNISFTPHSVGLYHSDHVGNSGLPPRTDMVLEPGMVLSVDCPLLEAGAGGSSHLEDLTLITTDGFENLNDISEKVIVV
jgi:Xaa-Pro aminopeptidase